MGSAFLTVALMIWAQADALSGEQELGYEELAPAQAVEPAQSEEVDDRAAKANRSFDDLMGKNAVLASPQAAEPIPMEQAPALSEGGQARMSIRDYQGLMDELRRHQRREPSAPPVILGASDYRGRAIPGALSLTMSLDVTLGAPGRWKTVPLIGNDVILVGAKRNGSPIPTSRDGEYSVWSTPEAGEVRLELEILVPARGPRGSIEFDFMTPRTPVTSFRCFFPGAGLEPRIDAAVRSELSAENGGTLMSATLRPTARIHLVGFRELADSGPTKAKVFTESLNLLSIDETALELFSVVRYTILYGATKDFALQVPAGFTVVAADGEGAFRYVLDHQENGVVLRGETAFPISNHYEVSLRLRRDFSKASGEESFDAPLLRAIGVEREQGWLGIEVPGKLRLTEKAREEALAIDLRQLPPEMVESAVSPLLRAYRYHSGNARVRLSAQRLPEKDPASASIDQVRARSVVSPEGAILTELELTLRNRLRPSLAMTLGQEVVVRSALLDGEPVKPSRDEHGLLVLPLKRSAGTDRLRPFKLQVVLESKAGGLGWFGVTELALPAVDLPISSMAWTLELPARNTYGALRSEVRGQTLSGHGSWSAAPRGPRMGDGSLGGHAGPEQTVRGSADGGVMPVRVLLPEGESTVALSYARYWIRANQAVHVRVPYLRSWLAAPIGTLLFLLAASLCFVASQRRWLWVARLGAAAGAVIVAWPLAGLSSAPVAGLALLTGFGAAKRRDVSDRLNRSWAWLSGLPLAWQARPRPAQRSLLHLLRKLALLGVFAVLFFALSLAVARLGWVLTRPLAG